MKIAISYNDIFLNMKSRISYSILVIKLLVFLFIQNFSVAGKSRF